MFLIQYKKTPVIIAGVFYILDFYLSYEKLPIIILQNMKIEQEIQQNYFPNPRIKALVNILLTHNRLEGAMKQLIEPYGITPQQYNVLRILRGQYPNYISLSSIRERLIDKMSDTSRIIDRLDVKELIEKFASKKDRRLVDIRISPSGLDLLKRMEALEQSYNQLLSHLSDEEALQLSDLLDKFRDWNIEE